MALALLLVLACGPEEPAFNPNVADGDEDTAEPCPEGMVFVQGGGRTLGESDEDIIASYGDNVIVVDDFAIESFCIAELPFPGEEGDDWPEDGLRYTQVEALDAQLPDLGRRLCTVTELTYAAAGKDNWRYPFDAESYREGVCDPDDTFPQPIGTFEDCESPFGVRDFQVRSTWGRLDEDMADVVGDQREDGLPEDHDYAVWGGPSRQDTYYAPTNFGVHFHEVDSKAYTDDGFRVCADRGALEADVEETWARWLDDFREAGSYANFLGE